MRRALGGGSEQDAFTAELRTWGIRTQSQAGSRGRMFQDSCTTSRRHFLLLLLLLLLLLWGATSRCRSSTPPGRQRSAGIGGARERAREGARSSASAVRGPERVASSLSPRSGFLLRERVIRQDRHRPPAIRAAPRNRRSGRLRIQFLALVRALLSGNGLHAEE